MGENSSRPNHKRPFPEDDESNKQAAQKRVRFPKGRKVKSVDEVMDKGNAEDDSSDLMNPRFVAKARTKRRNQMASELCSEENRGIFNDISAAEVTYGDNESFVDDGIQIEPFNLDKEREEGYFDAQGNFVEYVNDNEIKDAWLDNVEVVPQYTGKSSMSTTNEDDVHDLSSEAIAKMKRRIADVLEPGETVLHALKRLKGTSSDRKAKMSAETKIVFDQLTEDAMKLMENGEYDVYHEMKEVFDREAEGYEELARARGEGTSLHSSGGNYSFNGEKDLFSEAKGSGVVSSTLSSTAIGHSNPNIPTAEVLGTVADEFDMFAEDEHATTKPSSELEGGALENDYVYDESSGYYYSSSLGYYYDPSTGLYCSAASGQWYSFNEETGSYNEINEVPSNAS
ncbi:CD2 antigen cytoplasmic tail-binding protein 2 [Quillaja saponaria]|uniref:CD2 antigen cytoplasmic tail-binding protein 2 n=1 Tax=Quillaja saponaria TaxID=32244 RepID=A0AAD7PUY3_QUISA|nr:CD2 antigen cytoplasmic tail-binding protein 2 [Quillaja saponaria]